LKACGFGQLRSSPAGAALFNDISSPASIHEVALRRLWTGLPMELLPLAFSNYKFLEGGPEKSSFGISSRPRPTSIASILPKKAFMP
jgi:hypothetical protein